MELEAATQTSTINREGVSPGDAVVDNQSPSDPATLPPIEEQKRIIKELIAATNAGLVIGARYYLLSTSWWRRWKSYVGYDDAPSNAAPGPIDNSGLTETVEGEIVVKKNASEMWDYEIVSEECWRRFESWFSGGPAICRKAIALASRMRQEVVLEAATIEDFALQMCQRMGLARENVRIWDYHAGSRHKLLEQLSKSLEESMIIDENKMLLEEKDADGNFPEIQTRSSYYSSSPYTGSSNWSYGSSRERSEPGKVGLGNLGNTCFMNSALQCLSATAPLTDYFFSGKYLQELNPDNPLGMHGEIAKEYGNLLKQLWSGDSYAAEPRSFKWTLARFAPQFDGYQQHDSQELLAFLLDGLHEDLNRILRKPYVPAIEDEGRPDPLVASLSWAGHKSRNDSIIVDLFQGQLKSRVKCPVCPRVSITFDPFMYLSLPLPIKSTRSLNVTLRRQSGEIAPTQYQVIVDKAATVLDFKRELGSMAGVPAQNIVLVDVYHRRFYRQIKSEESIDVVNDNDILFAYEIELSDPHLLNQSAEDDADNDSEPSNELISVPVLQVCDNRLVNFPFVVSVPANVTYAGLYSKLLKYLQRYLSGPVPSLSTDEYPQLSEATQPPGETDIRDAPGAGMESDSDDEPATKSPVSPPGPRWGGIFDITLSDAYGVARNRNRYVNDDEPLDLDGREILCLVWSSETLDKFWNAEAMRDITLDASMKRKDDDDDESHRNEINLKDCIQLFMAEETLGVNDMWYCSSCKEHRQAHKKMDIWKLPPVLVIHLKRFSYKSRYNREKIDTLVDFPLEGLDFSDLLPATAIEATDNPPVYDLFAVSNHYGSMGGGHYTAYAKHRDNGKWYHYDDRSVSPVGQPEGVKTAAAYVLFYRRRDLQQFSTKFSTNPPSTSSSASEGIANAETSTAPSNPAVVPTLTSEHGTETVSDRDVRPTSAAADV